MERIGRTLVLAVVMNSVVLVLPVCAASEAAAPTAEVELKQVALFKNGLGFFASEVTCPRKTESFSFVPQVAASHGSFWVSYPPKMKLASLAAKEVDAEEQVEAITIAELLRANVGSRVRLYLSGKEQEVLEGVIMYFPQSRPTPKGDPYAPGRIVDGQERHYPGPYHVPSLVMVETDQGQVAVNPQSVMRVEFVQDNAERTYTKKTKSFRLDVRLGARAGGKKLTVSYLAKGITWAPSYVVDISDQDKAHISAKAAVINEACDLNGISVQLVTGFPHLQFADVVSPLAMKENLAQFLQALIKGQSEQREVAVVMSQRAWGYGGMGGMMGGAYEASTPAPMAKPAYGTAEAGRIAEDLFLYPVENVHLAKGEVGYLPLFTEQVPYSHIYKWDIPDYVNEQENYRYDQRRGGQPEREEQVWHCVRLENTTKVPWTTAPAQTVKEGMILGQDTLGYTPVKDKATLRITQAVSVKAEQLELEIERKRDAAQLYGHHYDLVTVEGKLSVTNFQDKAITLEITKTLSGEVKSSQPEAKIEALARGLRRMNGVRKLTWTIVLEPGEEKKLDYIYDVYVRR